MEIITLHLLKEHGENRKEIAEKYIRENITSEDNSAVLVAGFDPRTGRDKVFHVLVLKDVKKTLQWNAGEIYRHSIEEGGAQMALEYMSKHPCVFVCQ